VGYQYYLLPRAARYASPAHALLKPSGLWGHGVGILATVVMLSNFVYAIRKRVRLFKGKASLRPWLRFHVFVGLLSPLTILFHTAFQWGNQLATLTYTSLIVVVGTGLVGRYIYGLVRLDPADAVEAKRLGEELARVTANLPAAWTQRAEVSDPPLHHVLCLANGTAAIGSSVFGYFLGDPFQKLRLRRGLRRARALFLERADHRSFAGQVTALWRLRARIQMHRRLKHLMTAWRGLHVVLACVLLVLIGLHVWVSVRVGFRWIWR
jgi:hypothetical protein